MIFVYLLQVEITIVYCMITYPEYQNQCRRRKPVRLGTCVREQDPSVSMTQVGEVSVLITECL